MTKFNFLIILALSLSACTWNDKQFSLDQNSPHGLKSKQTGKWRCQSGENKQWLCDDLSKPGSPILATKAEQKAATEEHEPNLDDSALASSAPKHRHHLEPNMPQPASVPTAEATPTATNTRATATPTTGSPTVKNTPSHITIANAPNSYVTVQIMAAKKAGTIESVKQRHPQIAFIDIETMINDEPWQVLLLGVYPNVGEAEQAVEAMGFSLNDVWIRSVGQIKRSLTNQP